MPELQPFVWFYLAALLAAVTRGRLRAIIVLLLPVFSAVQLAGLPEDVQHSMVFLGYELTPFRVDRLSLLFAWVFHIAALLGLIFSLHVRDTVQQVAGLLYAGNALGAVFAGDLLTLFVFWEMLALSSVFLI